jgi:asparagine synthase (glutamine-hydrolysing)
MCGIAGKLSRRGVPEPLIHAMCDVIVHRGPDSRGIYLDDGVGLGIQRLAVIDLITGDQPVSNEDESVVVVLNGEIYNYVELRERLQADGHVLRTSGDTEVIVHLYEDHGHDCVRFLRGMFAFALWDRRRRQLLLARDRLGKKPLFYAQRGDELWFASEAKAILQDPEVPREPDWAAIDAFLQWGYVPHPQSAFVALRKLPPAHTLLMRDGEVRLQRYWRLTHHPHVEKQSRVELAELVREQLLESTRIRLRSDVPLGAFLSGGIDSTAVVGAMARVSSTPIKTFTIGFDHDDFDETSYAREIAGIFGAEHHELRCKPAAMSILPKLIWHYGEPFADQAAIPTFLLSELTREHVTVALNGDGGDELFAGYQRYWAAALSARLGVLPPSLTRRAAALARYLGAENETSTTRARLVRVLAAAGHAESERYAVWMSLFDADARAALYSDEFRAGLDLAAPLDVIVEPYRASDGQELLERLQDVDLESYLTDQLLVKVDIASMAHSLEVRSPLLDHHVAELAARLPVEAKLDGRTGKRVLRDVVRSWVPEHIVDRPKHGFGVPLADWFRTDLRVLARDVLLDEAAVRRGIFRRSAVERMLSDHESGRSDQSSKIWALIQVELWLRTFVDHAAEGPVALPVPGAAAAV